ncbi:MAG: GC-type dockerin domain-anchored protein, partial [Phycisphaerales bacterium]
GFGSSIAIEGSTMYVGAPYSDGWAGSIHLIDLQTRLFAGQILSDDTISAGSALFGTSLAIDDGVLVIGSRLFSGCNGAFASTAYFYDTSTGIQTQAHGGDCYGDTGFADSVFVAGSIAAISETLYSSSPGVVHLYHTQAPEIVHSFEAPVSDTETWFGDAMIVHNGMMIIGAPRIDSGASDSGEIYAFGLVLPCGPADMNTDGALDFFDVSRFVNRWGYPETDLNGDLTWDFFDVSTFIDLFNAGCP